MELIRTASFFCGCGGMDYGLLGGFTYLGQEYKKMPFDIVYAVDNDPYCTQIYNLNFEHKCMQQDVRDIDASQIPDIDLLIGGFPCQSFSISAQNPPRLGYKDERGMLFFEMVKTLKAKKPRFFIAENVKGLLSANNKKAFPMILKEFMDAGYYVKHKLLNASDYGVPQKRERVIMVGFREKSDCEVFHFPETTTATNKVPLRVAIDDTADKDERWFFSDKAVEGMMAVKEKMNKGRIQNLDEPCNTISSHLAKVSINSTDPVLMVKGRYRRFTPRECARIQSFPEQYDLGKLADGRKYRAIGNAVPPVLMWQVANALARVAQTNSVKKKTSGRQTILSLDFNELKEEYPNNIIDNNSSPSDGGLDVSRNLLICLVKSENVDLFLDGSANIYYTGKKFPSTVELNHLYYFMPYIKGKGIRDLYYIKVARVGTKAELTQRPVDENDIRLVFEISFVKQLFDDYKPIELKIWHTFTDTTLEEILAM